MHRLNKVTLPDNHPISKCWHPHYHLSPFQGESAKIFERWYRRRYSDESSRIMRAVPLCVFAGVQFSPYVLNECAKGTYAVCRSCTTVIMCGYNDRAGLGPRACSGCGGKLELNDYFQPVEQGSNIMGRGPVDPEKDPAMTMAEVCALSASGVPLAKLGAVIAVLHDENLIEKGEYIVESLAIVDGHITSRAFVYLGTVWANEWFATEMGRNVKVTPGGRIMLKAREMKPKRGAKKRVSELLAMEGEKLQATSWKALANRHLV